MTDQPQDQAQSGIDQRLRALFAVDPATVARITHKALSQEPQVRHPTRWRLAAATTLVTVIAVFGLVLLPSSPPAKPSVVTICSLGDVVVAVPEQGTTWITNTGDETDAGEPTIVIVKGERQ